MNIKTKITLLFLCYTPLLESQTRGIQLIPDADLRYNLIAPLDNQTLILSQPGNYKFSKGINSELTTSTTLIRITSSNVTLDLQNFSIRQSNAATATNFITGIEIADNLSNILIKNGKVSNVTSTGIIVGQDCFNVSFYNMYVTKTQNTGIYLSEGGSNIIIDNCLVANSTTKNDTTIGIRCLNIKNIIISHSSIMNLKSETGHSTYGIFASNCNNGIISDSIISDLEGKHVLGLALNTCIDWEARNNISSGNIARDGSSTGFYLVKSLANKIRDCITSNNSATENAYGIQVKVNSNYNRFTNCISSNNNSTGTGSGYGILINKGNSNYIGMTETFANAGGTDASSEGAGIKITESNGCFIEKCKCEDNNGGTGIGYGIFLSDINQCIIEDNQLYYNHGTAGSYGIREVGIPSSYVASNVAFGNAQNFDLQQATTLNSIQNIQFNAPRSVQRSHRGNVNILG